METNFNSQENESYNDNDINLIYFFNRLIRNKNLIALFTFISILIAITSYALTKKTWQGEFQIVLSSEKNNVSRIPINLQQLSSIKGNNINNKLKTQVGILKSPSVLMPIFQFVNEEKRKLRPQKDEEKRKLKPQKDELNFSDWERSLKIKLKKGTSILDISYKDQDREIIIPVLEKMSKAFQDYSGKDKFEAIRMAKNYLIEQKNIYKLKSADSIKQAQKFAISHDLLINNELKNSLDVDKSENFITENYRIRNTSIEGLRVKVANEIRNLNEQIKKIESLDNDANELQYIGSTIPALVKEGLPQNLERLESNLAELRTRYTEKDKDIQFTIKRRNLLIGYLKKRAIGYLKAERNSAEAFMKSLMRPEGVVLKYKELMREASRDEATLISLENKLREILLEEAKYEDPWELITNPTLKENPIAPRLRNFGIVGLISGSFLGIAASILYERKKDIIYEKDILNNYFPNALIVNFEKKPIDENEKKYLNEIIKNSKNIIFNSLLELIDREIEFIKSKIKKESFEKLAKDKIIFTTELLKKENKDDFKFFVVNINQITYADLNFFLKTIQFNKHEFNAILYI